MRLIFLTKNVSVIGFGRIQGHLIFFALLFQLLKIICSPRKCRRNSISYFMVINNSCIFYNTIPQTINLSILCLQ